VNPSESSLYSASLIDRRKVVVRFENVSRCFANDVLVRALNNVSFEVFEGEVLGLLGGRGSGKSTILRILAGAVTPSEGNAIVLGHSPGNSVVRRRIAYRNVL